MITRILVPLDSSEFSRTATQTACHLARKNGAEVVGITILDMLGLTGQIAPIHAVALKAYHESLHEAEIDAKERIQYALGYFRQCCKAENVSHSEHKLQGISSNAIVEAAAYCDLVVMGLRTYFRHLQREGSTLVDVLDRSATPILAIPKHSPDLPKTALIAYDGSHHATRALHATAALHQVAPLEKVSIVTSHPNPMERSFLLQQAAAYLRAHHVDDVVLIDTEANITDIVHEDYLDKVDLVALGIHSKHPFKDFFVGSLTKSLIDYGHKPLLLSQ
jgi:nucleotide-binding universal stress UspA family protein